MLSKIPSEKIFGFYLLLYNYWWCVKICCQLNQKWTFLLWPGVQVPGAPWYSLYYEQIVALICFTLISVFERLKQFSRRADWDLLCNHALRSCHLRNSRLVVGDEDQSRASLFVASVQKDIAVVWDIVKKFNIQVHFFIPEWRVNETA